MPEVDGVTASSTTIQRRSPVRGLVVSPFPHVAFLLSCVLSLELSTSSQSTHIQWLASQNLLIKLANVTRGYINGVKE